MKRLLSFFLFACVPFLTHAQVPFPALPQPVATFADEDRNWDIPPTNQPRRNQLASPTPTSIPGGRVIKAKELKALMDTNPNLLVIDVIREPTTHISIAGAVRIAGAGSGRFFGAEMYRFTAALAQLTGGVTNRARWCSCAQTHSVGHPTTPHCGLWKQAIPM